MYRKINSGIRAGSASIEGKVWKWELFLSLVVSDGFQVDDDCIPLYHGAPLHSVSLAGEVHK